MQIEADLERKFARFGEQVRVDGDGAAIAGYASLFGTPDQGGDVVAAGAYAASLKALAAEGRRVKMLWQHDPAQPIGVWDEVREDARGLWVRGWHVRFPAPMRATPSLTTYNPSAANSSARNIAKSSDTPIAGNNIGETGGRMYTDADTGDDGDPMAVHLAADAGLF